MFTWPPIVRLEEDELHEAKEAMLVYFQEEDGTLCERQGKRLQLHVEAAEGAHGKCLRALTPLERGACLVDIDAADALHIFMEPKKLVTTWLRLQEHLGACCSAFAQQARVPLTPALNTEVLEHMRAHDVSWQLVYRHRSFLAKRARVCDVAAETARPLVLCHSTQTLRQPRRRR